MSEGGTMKQTIYKAIAKPRYSPGRPLFHHSIASPDHRLHRTRLPSSTSQLCSTQHCIEDSIFISKTLGVSPVLRHTQRGSLCLLGHWIYSNNL